MKKLIATFVILFLFSSTSSYAADAPLDPVFWLNDLIRFSQKFASLTLSSPLQIAVFIFSVIGAVGAIGYFPHLAFVGSTAYKRRAAMLSAIFGMIMLFAVLSIQPIKDSSLGISLLDNELFIIMAPFGLFTIWAERILGHPLYQKK